MPSMLKKYFKLLVAVLFTGIVGGIIGGLFSHAISYVTGLRTSYGFLLFLLPVAGIATVFIYNRFKVSGVGTGNVFSAAQGEEQLSFNLAPAIFISSTLTHLCGGSAGREGAALQLGGGISALTAKIFKLSKQQQRHITMCGMAAVFAAVFGTPLAAAFFALEAPKKMREDFKAIIFTLISAFTGFGIARILKVSQEKLVINVLPQFGLMPILKVVLIAGLCGIVSYIFCISLFFSKKFFGKFFKNGYAHIALGGVIIIAVTLIIGTRDYNGAGTNIIAGLFEGETAKPYAFLFKIVLTALTVGAGYKGGEIVPAFFIGATFGSATALILGLPTALGAAVGMAVMFCGGTKCPLSTFFICCELFGINAVIYYIIAIFIGFVFSGNAGLYVKPDFNFLKRRVKDEFITTKSH